MAKKKWKRKGLCLLEVTAIAISVTVSGCGTVTDTDSTASAQNVYSEADSQEDFANGAASVSSAEPVSSENTVLSHTDSVSSESSEVESTETGTENKNEDDEDATNSMKPILSGITSGCWDSDDISDPDVFWRSMFFALFEGNYPYENKEVPSGPDADGSEFTSSRRLYTKETVEHIGSIMLNGSTDLPDFPDDVHGLTKNSDGYLLDDGVIGESWHMKYGNFEQQDDGTVTVTVSRIAGEEEGEEEDEYTEATDDSDFVTNKVSFVLRPEKTSIDQEHSCNYVIQSIQRI